MRSIFGFLSVFALSLMLSLGCGEGGGEGGSGGMAGSGGTGGSAGTGGTDICEGVVCDDGQPFCTEDDCDPSNGMCIYTPVEDGAACHSVSVYYGICVSGICRRECENDTECNDFDPCTEESCDPAEGLCDYTTLADGTACGESAVCVNGACRDLECEVAADCNDDFKDCTTEDCVSFGFCETRPVEDGTLCAGGECVSGECALSDSLLPCTEQGIRNAIAAGGGPYTFDCNGPTTVVTEAEILIDNDVILDGEKKLTVDGNDDHSVFNAAADGRVEAELRGLTVTGGNGGGIVNGIILTVSDSTISRNQGGGIITGGRLTVVNSTVSGNTNTSDGEGGGFTNGGELSLVNSTVSGNTGIIGGGIFHDWGTLTLTDSVVSGNTAYDGGGILAYGPLTLINSVVSENMASSDFGPIGGGIWVGTLAGTATLLNSTVSGNTAEYGGGIAISFDQRVTIVDSLISGNTASSWGGGIQSGGTLTVVNSTVSGNSAGVAGSGIMNAGTVRMVGGTLLGTVHALGRPDYFPTFEVASAIIKGACTEEGVDVTWTSNGYNVESPDNTCHFVQPSDQVNVSAEDLKLGPLQDNGGPTQTHALLPGSVAIDKIPAEDCVDADGQPLTTDQRGEPRPETGGTMCDVGAFEVQP